MIEYIADKWPENKSKLRDELANTPQQKYDYKYLLNMVLVHILGMKEPVIHEIDDGNYNGSLIYVFFDEGEYKYPCILDYYTCFADYGSCSGCDALEGIRMYDDGLPTENQLDEYMSLCLNLFQSIKPSSYNFLKSL